MKKRIPSAKSKPDLLLKEAIKLRDQGKLAEAKELMRRGFGGGKVSGLFLKEYGVLLEQLQDWPEAEKIYRAIKTLLPEEVGVDVKIIETLIYQTKYDDAMALIEAAEKKYGESRNLFHARNVLASKQGNHNEALRVTLKALRLDPGDFLLHNNIGSCLSSMGLYDQAATAYETALRLQPQHLESHINYAYALANAGRNEQAIAQYEETVGLYEQHRPHEAYYAKFSLSFLYLRKGELAKGWDNYRLGFFNNQKVNSSRSPQRTFTPNIKRWHEGPTGGAPIMVWREQGVGDELMFYSCLPDLKKAGNPVVVECENRLVSLMKRSFPEFEVRPPHYANMTTLINEKNDYGFQIPAGDLPTIYRRSLSAFENAQPYLVPDPQLVEDIRGSFERKGVRQFKVGICWRSGNLDAQRNVHYLNLKELEPILSYQNIDVVSLQYGDAEGEIRAAEESLGVRIHRWPDLDLKNDFDGVAALMKNLDLVISVGTTVAVLAAAVGVPTWRLDPSPLWIHMGTDTWPWVSGVRCFFPKEPGSGLPSVIPLVRDELEKLVFK